VVCKARPPAEIAGPVNMIADVFLLPGMNAETVPSVVQPETQLEGYLIVPHLAIHDMAAQFIDFEPLHVIYGVGCSGNGLFDGVFYGLGRRTDYINNLVNMTHGAFPFSVGCL